MKTPSTSPRFILTMEGPSARGQVAAVTQFLEQKDAYIEEFAVFDDVLTSRFYLRTQVRLRDGKTDPVADLEAGLNAALRPFPGSRGKVYNRDKPVPLLIMVSKTDHCLKELFVQVANGSLNMAITAVVSNHATLKPLADAEGVAFHHLPVTADNKAEQEARLLELIETSGAEFVLLARYMQVLSDATCRQLAGRVINIHHSFLPGFKGARPYEQAHARGVKLIGATAHFVTSDLDEGPIIEQALERVDHAFLPEKLLNVGRHIESVVLERAVQLVVERRVFVNGQRTVILR
jgi:formyltetrahydrofolate deformylase